MNSEWLWERLQILKVPIAFVLTPEPRNESVLILGPTGQDAFSFSFIKSYLVSVKELPDILANRLQVQWEKI